jgi:hypothetical protein
MHGYEGHNPWHIVYEVKFRSPHTLNKGKTTNEEWKSTIKDYPAPWSEIRIPDYLTLTVPSSVIRQVDDMEALAKFYKKFMKLFVELMGTTKMQKEERIVFDKQISMGNFSTKLTCLKIHFVVKEKYKN